MIKVGITGGIGSGKTTVCKVFELLGVPVYYADLEAKNILDNDRIVFDSIVELFGKEVLNSLSKIDRKRLASFVFNDKKRLDQLNAIVHPAVLKHFDSWSELNSLSPYILKEAAILFESGSYKNLNKIITVSSSIETRINRVVQRDKVSREEVEKRILNQMADEEKIKLSQFVIMNDEQQLIIPQILKIHNELSGS